MHHLGWFVLASSLLALPALVPLGCASGDSAPSPTGGGGTGAGWTTSGGGGATTTSTTTSTSTTTTTVVTETEIALDSSGTCAERDCTVTLTYTGSASQVLLASEFTNWAQGALPMTQSGQSFSVTVGPSASVTAGILYAYKFVVDGTWMLDPENRYRKIVGGEMNSALKLPECSAGPELSSEAVSATAAGDMTVHVNVNAASDGINPTKVLALLDGAELPTGTWTTDSSCGVTFHFSGLTKGKHTLSLQAEDSQSRKADPIDLPFWNEDEPFDYRDGVLYMLMLDRFANGDKTNDQPIGSPVDYAADWHGGDLAGALAVMQTDYFEKLGVRTIWLSPVNEQTSNYESGSGNELYSAYHGYWPIRARDVEPRLGGESALHAFVTEAHKRGIRVIIDLINNQVYKDHEYVTPHAAWFRLTCQCGDDANNCGWSQRPIDCYFQPYLPDINWTVQEAETQFIADAVNWIAAFALDGFRVDAVKHVEANAVYNLRAALSQRFEQGGARIFMVGETAVGEGDTGTFFGESFTSGFQWIDAYTSQHALDGQFDFPTFHNIQGLINGSQTLSDVEWQIQKSLTNYKAGAKHVRFLSGHDNPRIASIAANDPGLGCNWNTSNPCQFPSSTAYTDPAVYQRLKRALTALYTMPGVPYLYMGDEVATPGGNDPDMRRDMRFDEAALAALEMVHPGNQVVALTAQQVDLRDWVRKLGQVRTSSPALRRGQRVTLLGTDPDFWIYAWQGNGDVVVVALNRGSAGAKSVSAGSLNMGGKSSFNAALATGSASLSAGSITVNLGAGEAGIFVAQ